MADRRRKDSASGEAGMALLTVLLLVAVMAIVAATALERLTIATRLTANAGALDQARAFAEAAENVARLRIGDLVAAQPGKVTLQGGWLGAPQPLPVPAGTATARVTDGGNCFNLNSVVAANEGEGEENLKVRPTGVTQFQALMRLLGIDDRQAQTVAASLADWIDTDTVPQPGGAEDETYARAPTPYRTANRFMASASELRSVNGVTPAIYQTLRPWICALPTADLSPINVNTLLPAQAPLFAMLLPGQLTVDQARQMLARRPADGYGSTVAFWALPALQKLTPMGDVQAQTKLVTRFFRVEILVDLGGTELNETALIDAQPQKPARLVSREWGEGA
ncbi:type II secretion system minor pseudopilin GspK [Sphingobium phenoxybenzoativorans]|uniref:Type II secretion system protein K n=1 Tax=Sphingobium phenoxybenzoativorans TaxID=1592790 RepID=A0A975Q3P0_9SPHN|nr:type II secretion system minor pseudopilin GspK [Sphingobium phenoxybenzoativorans]QUT07722.1 type II secretion system minor pseudopilin GspK [Sphingobium phenoxybenzoativorans]